MHSDGPTSFGDHLQQGLSCLPGLPRPLWTDYTSSCCSGILKHLSLLLLWMLFATGLGASHLWPGDWLTWPVLSYAAFFVSSVAIGKNHRDDVGQHSTAPLCDAAMRLVLWWVKSHLFPSSKDILLLMISCHSVFVRWVMELFLKHSLNSFAFCKKTRLRNVSVFR